MSDFWALSAGIGLGAVLLIGILFLKGGQSKAAKTFVKPADVTAPRDVRNASFVRFDRSGAVQWSSDFAALFGGALAFGTDWRALQDRLVHWFPELPLKRPETKQEFVCANAPDIILQACPDADGLLLTLDAPWHDLAIGLELALAAHESDSQRVLLDQLPQPAWFQSCQDGIVWQNPAFSNLTEAKDICTKDNAPFDLTSGVRTNKENVRIKVTNHSGGVGWFEVQAHPVEGGLACFAFSVDAQVEAEDAQRNFVQTLTKTFAHLPIGLAVFDRNQQLALFNPALVDLTRLKVTFLSGRPTLASFFDHLRESRMLPERKDFGSWRDRLADVIQEARNDRFNETWNLPSGLTYKITGRPHPDGAIAFLIEDISAEISLTRRFRSELDLSQSVIDNLDCAIAVFSQLGVLTSCNKVYRELWKTDPDAAFAEMSIVDAIGVWKSNSAPTSVWPDLRDYVLLQLDRQSWKTNLTLHTGETLHCLAEPVANGATMVRFISQQTLNDLAFESVSSG